MKKFFYMFLFLTLFTFIKPVLADEAKINYHRLDAIFYNQIVNGEIKSNHVTSFELNGRMAYCIEPGVDINERFYDITDWSAVNFSNELKEFIEKVGYYGYEYPGHQTNNYYIAAQELIWKKIKPDINVTWTTEKDLGGNIIDISKEKEEILKLVNNHSLLPSFSLGYFTDYISNEIVLEDKNNVLDYYDISESKFHKISREGNVLKIKLSDQKVEDEDIILTRKHYDNAPLLIYSKGSSQKLAALRITSDKSTSFKIGNKEKPYEEVIEVPNTGIDNKGICILFILSGLGMVIGAIKIC